MKKAIKVFLFSFSIFFLASNIALAITPQEGINLTDGEGSVSGAITASSCSISFESSNCIAYVTATWTGSGPYAVDIYLDEVRYTGLAGGTSPSTVNIGITYGSHEVSLVGVTNTGSSILSTKTISASCRAGTVWNNSICSTPGGTLTATSCSVAQGATTCNASLTWTTTNVTGGVSVNSSYPSADTVVSTAVSGTNVSSLSSRVPKGSSATFTLKNSGVNIISKTVTPAYGSFSTSSCVIADFESSCVPTFSYTTTNTTTPVKVTTPDEIVVASTTSGTIPDTTHLLDMVNSRSRDYFLYNNGVLMDSITIAPTCASGNWGGSYCLPSESSFSDNGSLSASTCNISELGTSCLTTISWGITSVNDIGEKVRIYVNSNDTYLKEINTSSDVKSGSFTATVPYGTNTFYLEGINGMIKRATGQAICSEGTVWDNTKCLGIYAWNEMVLDHFTVSHCSLPEGGDGCGVIISWGINPFPGNDTAIVKASVNGSVSTIFYGNSGSQSYTVGRDTVDISLYYRDSRLGLPISVPTYGEFNNLNMKCVIASTQSTCVPNLLWNVSNSVYLPKITATINGVLNTQIATGTSGSFNDSSHPLGYQESRSYFLSHDGTQLDSVKVTAVCADNTHWNGTLCSPGYVTLGISNYTQTTTCTIPINGSSCDLYPRFTWTTSVPLPTFYTVENVPYELSTHGNATTPSKKLKSGTGYQNLVNNVGSITLPTTYTLIGPSSETFDFVYDTKILDSVTATSYCADGAAWDGTRCSPATFTATDCTIALGESTCPSKIDFKLNVNANIGSSWSSGVAYYHVTRDITSIKDSSGVAIYTSDPVYKEYLSWDLHDRYRDSNLEVAIENQLAARGYSYEDKCSFWTGCPTPSAIVTLSSTLASHKINYGKNILSLYNNFSEVNIDQNYYTRRGIKEMASVTPTATCGTSNNIQLAWDGTKCVLPTGTISRETCVIPAGNGPEDNHCSANVTWKVTNPLEGANTAFNAYGNSPSNPQSTATSGTKAITAYYGIATNTNLYHNGVELAKSTVVAQCAPGTIWNFEGQKWCISTAVPLDGDIWNSTCTVPIGGRECQFDLSWNAWSTTGSGILKSSYISIIYDGQVNGSTIPANGVSEQIEAEGFNWTSDRSFDTIPAYDSSSHSAKYTLPDRDVDYNAYYKDTTTEGDNGTIYRSATFNLVGSYEYSLTGNIYSSTLASVRVTAECAGNGIWVNDVCTARPTPVVTVSVVKTSDQTVIPTETNWISRIVSGVVSRIVGKRTVSVFVPETPVTIRWSVDEGMFNQDSIVCILKKDGNELARKEKSLSGSYDVSPTDTSKYTVTCTD